MRKKLLLLPLLVLFLIGTNTAFAQSTGNYTYSTSTSGSLALDKDGNTINMGTGTTELYGPNVDTYTAAVQNLSFPFVFMGVAYTQFSVSPDGGVRFGSTAISGHTYSPAAGVPIISLTNIDNKTGVGTGKVHYKVQAGTGGQVLIIEWKDILINYNAAGTTLSTFQLRLYQASGIIEMVYGQMWNSSTSAQSGVIWFGSSNTTGTVGQLNSITTTPSYDPSATSLITTSFTASSAMTNLHSTSDGSRRVFTFTPPVPPAPTSLNFTGVTMSGMTLNWTDATGELGYLVFRSLDGVNYTFVTSLAANTVSYTATGLGANTTYYWRVFSFSEGALSSPLSGSETTSSGTLSGTRTIGSGGDYATLTAAITDIQTNGLAGALTLEFLSTYTGGETFPITLTNLTTSHTSTLTIRPASGVTGITISGSHATNLIRIENEDYIIIDGRPGGSGTARELTFSNTNTAGTTFTFINEASNNTIRYCVIRGVNTSTSSGVILFSTTTGSNGNDNNLIEYCDIRDGASTPTNLIYGSGTTTTLTHHNSGNTISNCNIFNYYNSTSTSNAGVGINLAAGNSEWTIDGNSFYQTTTRATFGAGATQNAILVASSLNYGIVITNNFIGGTAPSCGGSAYTLNASTTLVFRAIQMTVASSPASSLQGNVIKNISVTTTSTSTAQSMLSLVTGSFNCGNVTGNTIGDHGTGGAITFSTSGTGALFAPILAGTGTPGIIVINNNNIANINITLSGTGTVQVRGISAQGTGTYTINNNTIGGTAANSILNNTNHTTYGIHVAGTSATATINGNTLQNISTNNTGTAGQLWGIYSQAATSTINNNVVRRLSTNNTNTGVQLIGIIISNTASSNNTISQNTIHTLKQTNSGSGTTHHAYGIYYNAGTTGTNVISRNFIHSLTLATTGSAITTQIRGIEIFAGACNVVNNMIRVGIDEAGGSVTGNYFIQGINKSSTSVVNIYHNSVFVGGSGVGTGSQPTHAFRRAATGTDDVRNNIFVNARSNGAGTGKHYGIVLNASTTITSNFNLFHVTGTGGVFGSADGGTTDRATLLAWQSATGFDGNSAHGSPNFVNATGGASAVDLHVTSPTPIEGQGTAIASVTDDFDGETRSTLTPVDIGADAGDFILVDIFPPSISYTALLHTASTSNRTLASVTITDVTGVPTSGPLQPRIWFRRSAPTTTSWGSTQGSLTSGSGTSGVWSFLIDYGEIGVTPTAGETYQYYVVAQDEASTPNIGTQPIGGVHTDVNNQTSAPPTPNSYNIVAAFSGSYNVGTSETYTSLTGAAPGGIFAALNSGALTGNVTINITSDLTEDGTNGLNQLLLEGGSWTVTIQPSEATERLISGAVAAGMIRFNGADNITIDGRSSGSGKYLRFRNTNTSNPTFTFINDASGNLIRDCFIEGATTSTTNGVVFFSTGTTTGNDNNTIQNCVIRDRSDAAGVPANLIYSAGSSATITNTGNSITSNELFNFTARGIQTTTTGNENWNISGNEIYQTAARTTAIYGVDFNSLGTNTISQNIIRDMNTSAEFRGINLGDARSTTVSRNRIYQTTVSGSTSAWTGIYFAGSSGNPASVTLVNNQITIVPTSSSSQTIRGIYDFGFTGNTCNAYYNSVYIGGTATGTATWAYVRGTITPTTSTLRNNLFFNGRSGGSVNHFAIGDQSHGSGTFVVSNNFYSGLGTTAANFMDRGTASGGTPESFSSWRTGKSDFTSYALVSTDITVSSLFNAVSSGDLNIITSNPEAWLVNGKGIVISGIADDFDATAVRSTTAGDATDIGADEFLTFTTPPAATASGAPAPSTTTTYTTFGNPNVSITWGASGTVPTSVTARYYSGTRPPFGGWQPIANQYWDITQTDGSGFSYNITLTYDENHLGGIPESNLHPAKSDDGGITWHAFLTEGTDPGQFERNTTNNTITLYGMTSFSLFGLGDSDQPLPVRISSFTASVKDRNVQLRWTTATEINNAGFEIERKLISENDKLASKWNKVAFVQGSGNSNRPVEYTYVDEKLNSGKYAYRLKMIDYDGSFDYSDVIEIEIDKPTVTKLEQNYPNSFNPATIIEYQLANPSRIAIEVFSITGEKVATLVNNEQEAGYYNIAFDASKYGLGSGIYFYRMIAIDNVTGHKVIQTKKMMYLK